jgi:hypothetical protein
MVSDTKIMSPRNDAGTAEVARPHMEQLVAPPRILVGRGARRPGHRVLTGEYLPLPL